MNTKDLKEIIIEVMNEIDYNKVALDAADDIDDQRDNDWWTQRSRDEQEVLKLVVKWSGAPNAHKVSFTDLVKVAAAKLGKNTGDWPTRKKAWKGDIKFYPKDALNWVCKVATTGLQGGLKKTIIKPTGGCPESWGAKDVSLDSGGASSENDRFIKRLTVPEQRVLSTVRSKFLNKEYPKGTEIEDALKDVANKLGISERQLPFLKNIDAIKAYLQSTLPTGTLSEDKKKKKRGFGEGKPPDEEIYTKREVIQELDLESPEAAEELSAAAEEQGEASTGLASAQEKGAEAAKQRQDASKAWKDSKITQIKAVDAAEKLAGEEAKAADAQKKAIDSAQKAQDAIEKAGAEKEKMLDIAKQAHEQEQEAAEAAQEAAAAEEEAYAELQQGQEDSAAASKKTGEAESEFGKTLASDEEGREKEKEEEDKTAEEAAKEEEEADKEEEDKAEAAEDGRSGS